MEAGRVPAVQVEADPEPAVLAVLPTRILSCPAVQERAVPAAAGPALVVLVAVDPERANRVVAVPEQAVPVLAGPEPVVLAVLPARIRFCPAVPEQAGPE